MKGSEGSANTARYPAVEIRRQFPNVSMSFVTYLRSKGYIKPEKLEASEGGRPTYLYSKRDIRLVGLVWQYSREAQEKLKLDAAYRKAVLELENPSLWTESAAGSPGSKKEGTGGA